MRVNWLSIVVFAGLSGCVHICPPSTQQNVVDRYHGVEVRDDYRWLEDWTNPEVRTWSDSQNAYARSFLDKLPNVENIRKKLVNLHKKIPKDYSSLSLRPGRVFALKSNPPLNHPLLVVMPSIDRPDSERVVLDPNQLDKTGSISMDWYVPSPDGSLVAVSLSLNGTEAGDVHVFETESRRQVGEPIKKVNGGTAGGYLAWANDGSGFYYTRYPMDGERPKKDQDFYQQVWFHAIGTKTTQDRYEIGKDFPRIAECKIQVQSSTGKVLVTVQYGDGRQFAFYLRGEDGAWSKIADYDDGILQAVFGTQDDLWLISRKNAPKGKLLRIKLDNPDLKQAVCVIPEGDDAMRFSFSDADTMVVSQTRLYLTYQTGGPVVIRAFDHRGNQLKGPRLKPVSNVEQIIVANEDDLLFRSNTFLDPPAWRMYDATEDRVHRTKLFGDDGIDFSDVEVLREVAISKDKTRVPLSIICPKNISRDKPHPLVLYGYGGYGRSVAPRYNPDTRIWMDHGVLLAYANTRGGGEYGDAWHRVGSLTNKQVVFDDFYGVMRYLVQSGYTRPKMLAIRGGSNGGLLMGAMITQHTEDFRATVSYVGIYDMLRFELSPNGMFNVPEFGTVANPDHFKAMFAYSPYHRVKDETAYPAVMFITGANDPRVDPMHSRKMTARLQKATSSKLPILLRTSSNTGHGIGTPLSEKIAQKADEMVFVFHYLGVSEKTCAQQ